jgi:hypothetical protein
MRKPLQVSQMNGMKRKYRYQKQDTAANIWNCKKSIENAGSYVPTCTCTISGSSTRRPQYILTYPGALFNRSRTS